MDQQTLFSLLNGISQQQSDKVQELCKNQKFNSSLIPNPLSVALRLTPHTEESLVIINTLLEAGLSPSPEDINAYHDLTASDKNAVLSERLVKATPPRKTFFFWKKKTILPSSETTQLWHQACQNGNVPLSQYLLSTYSPSHIDFDKGLETAKQSNHHELIASFVSHPLFTLPKKRELLDFAVAQSQPVIVKALIQDKQHSEPQGFTAILKRPFTTLWQRIRYGNPATSIKKALVASVKEKKPTTIVSELLQEPHITFSSKERTQLLEILFEKDTLPPSNYALTQTLLKDRRITPVITKTTLEKKAHLLAASENQALVSSSLSSQDLLQAKNALSPIYACLISLQNGHFEIAKFLLAQPEKASQLEQALLNIAPENHTKLTYTLFNELLSLSASPLSYKMIEEILDWAIAHDQLQLIETLLSRIVLDQKDYINTRLIYPAIRNNACKTLTALIKNPEIAPLIDIHQALHLAAQQGSLVLLTLFLAADSKSHSETKLALDPSSTALIWAAQEGHIQMATLILKQQKLPQDLTIDSLRKVPADHYMSSKERLKNIGTSKFLKALESDIHLTLLAATFGYSKTINALLKEKHEPLLVNLAFCYALKNGHLEIVQTLLNDPLFNPAINNNEPIRLASEMGYQDIVSTLLQDKRVNAAAENNYAIRLAAQNGHLEIVKTLLQHKGVDPTVNHNEAIRLAAQKGHLDIVKLLLNDSRIDPSVSNNYIFRWAAESGHIEIVSTLLEDKRINPADIDNYAICLAAQKGHLAVVNTLLLDPRIDPSGQNNKALLDAIQNGHAAIVDTLLVNGRVDPTIDNNAVIRWAAKDGLLDIVNKLLETQNPNIDPTAENNYAIRWAAANGHVAVLRRLLQVKQANPGDQNNEAIRWAAQKGHLEIINILLADKERVNPADQDNEAILWAIDKGYLDIVERLLQDERVDPADRNNEAIRRAAMHGHLDIVKTLLEHPSVLPNDCNNEAIRWASMHGHLDIVDTLIKSHRTNPADCNNEPLCLAAQKGHLDIVNRLLEEKCVNPADRQNKALYLAAKNGYLDIVNRLLQDKRVNPADRQNRALYSAAENGHLDIVNRLLKDRRVDPADHNNEAFYLAAKNGHLDIVSRLLEDTRVNPADKQNRALYSAAQNGHLDIVSGLLEDTRVNPANRQSGALYLAAQNGHIEIIKRLLQEGRNSVNPNNRISKSVGQSF